jgi:DNA repair exonuclease SbcCD ATPase subunit
VKSVKFKNLSIQNFLSVGEEKLKINFQSGITLITGINKDKESKNGCGKTTILDALYWSIFGNTIRDIKKDKIIHDHLDVTSKVELEFEVTNAKKNVISYKIERTLNPSKVILYKKNEDTTYSTIQKTDEAIKQIVGANEELFRNSVIMSLDNTLPFMAQKKIEKRKFIEGILQINVFSEMLSKVRQDYNELKKKYEIETNKFTEKQKLLVFLKEQKVKNENNKKNKINSLKEKIKENDLKIKNNNSTNIGENIKKIKQSLEKTENVLTKIDEKIEKNRNSFLEESKKETKIQTEIDNLEKQIKILKNKTGNCPTCKRKLTEENDESINSHIESLLNEIKQKEERHNVILSAKNKVNSEKNNFICKKTELTNIIKDFHTKLKKLEDSTHEILILSNRNKELYKEIDEIIYQKDDFINKLDETEAELKETEKKLSDQSKMLDILEKSKTIVSEEGVKTYIVKKLLVLLNTKLNFYLKKLETPCTCTFDELFDEIIINDKGKECSYFNFSGGERKRIDLAILFTFQDVLKTQTGVFYSLSMYDELFDSALDDAGTNKAIEILRENVEKHQECVYIISHNTSVSKNNIDYVIELEKSNGQTKIVN